MITPSKGTFIPDLDHPQECEDFDGFVADCDCCGNRYDDNEGTRCFFDADEARWTVEDEGWLVIGDLVICNACIKNINKGKIKMTAKFEMMESAEEAAK